MKKSLLKNLSVLLLVCGLLFSSVPHGVFLSLWKTYAGARDLADKFWELEADPNVVDNFLDSDFADLLAVHTAYAAAGDARMQYGTGTNSVPQTRFYTSSNNSWGSANATVAGTASVNWVVSKESPTEDVTVVATQSSTGKLDIFCRSGAVWSKDVSNVSVGTTGATRRFDLEFEKTSGVPMVLYSTNNVATNELAYYRKTGAGCGAGSWTAAASLNPTVVTGAVLWVELEARQTNGTNVMAAAFSDASATQGGKLEAMVWNGGWGNESPAGAAQGWSDLSLELQGTAGANAAKVFDLAFETNSGDLLVAWGTSTGANGINGWRYATCAAALPCAWSGALTPAGPLDDATNVAIAPDPGSDAIAAIAQGNAGADLSAWLWTGSAVGATTAGNADATLLASAAGDMHVDIDWVVNGSQRMAVGVYAETTTGYKYIYYDSVGAAWRINTTTSFTITGAPATAMQSVQVRTNPNNKAQLLVNFTDANSDLWSKRLSYNGAAGGATTALSTWSNSDGGVALDLSASSIASQAFWFDWVNYSAANAAPTVSISQPDGTGDTVTVGSTYNVTYSLNDNDNVVTAAFYYDTNNDKVGGTAITGACAAATEGAGITCAWNTTGISPGSYYVYGIVNDGVNPAVSAVSTGMITIQAAGSLAVDVVDGAGVSVTSPAAAFASRIFGWSAQTSTAALGSASQKLRVTNATAAPTWTLALAATAGSAALWQSGGNNYDFNGSAAAGRLRVDASVAAISPQSGCVATGLSKGAATYFAQGVQDSVNLITAGGSAQTGCYWDITGVSLTQDIPASQATGNYVLNMTLTAA